MTSFTKISLAVALTAIAASDAAAQWNVARFGDTRSRVYATGGLDPAFVTAAGAARTVAPFGRQLQLTGEAGVAAAKLDANDFRVRLGAQGSIARWKSVHLTGSATFVTRGTENAVYRGLNFGADVGGTVGVYRRRWFGGTELGFDKAIVTHISHSDWYRESVYAGAKDGWYIATGGTYRYGAIGGIAIGRAEVMARGGWLRTERLKALTPTMYAGVGVGFGF